MRDLGEILRELTTKALSAASAKSEFSEWDSFETTFDLSLGWQSHLQSLIDRGVDFNTLTSSNGRPAILHALLKRHYGVAKMLVEAGANINIESSTGETAWTHAGPLYYDKLLELGVDLHLVNREGHGAMASAVTIDHPEGIKKLKQAGCAIDILDANGDNLYHLAADAVAIEAMDVLSKYGLSVNHGRDRHESEGVALKRWRSPLTNAIAANATSDPNNRKKTIGIGKLSKLGASLLDGHNAFADSLTALINYQNEEDANWIDEHLQQAIILEIRKHPLEQVAELATTLIGVSRIKEAHRLSAENMLDILQRLSNEASKHWLDAAVGIEASPE